MGDIKTIHDKSKEDARICENTILPPDSQLLRRIIEKQEETSRFLAPMKNDSNVPRELIDEQKEMNELLRDIKKSAEKKEGNQNRMLFAAVLIGAGETAGIFAIGSLLIWQSSGVPYYTYLQLGLAVILLVVGIILLKTQDKKKDSL